MRALTSLQGLFVLLTCSISSTIAKAEPWFGAAGMQCFSIPTSKSEPEPLVGLLANAGKGGLSESDKRLIDDFAESCRKGVNIDSLIRLFGAIRLNEQMSPVTDGLGTNRSRAHFYSAMVSHARDLQTTDPEKAANLLRSAAAISLLDFRAVARPTWVQMFSDAEVIGAMKLTQDQQTAFGRLMEAVRADSAATLLMINFVRSGESLFDPTNPKFDPEQLQESLKFAQEAWDRAATDLSTRWMVAMQIWKLKCLAASRDDEASIMTIRERAELMERSALDPVSQRWAREVVELKGAAPKGSGIKVLNPEDLRPKSPQ